MAKSPDPVTRPRRPSAPGVTATVEPFSGRHRSGGPASRPPAVSVRRSGSGQPQARTNPPSHRVALAAAAASVGPSRASSRSATQPATDESGLGRVPVIQARTSVSGSGSGGACPPAGLYPRPSLCCPPPVPSRWACSAARAIAAPALVAVHPGNPHPSSPPARNRAGHARASSAAYHPT